MKWVALATWVLTAGGGFFLLGLWLKNGGMQQSDQPGARIRAARVLSHFGLAATGLVLWIVYVATSSSALAWIAFAILLGVACSASRCSRSGWASAGGAPRPRPRPVGPERRRRPSSPSPTRSSASTACSPR